MNKPVPISLIYDSKIEIRLISKKDAASILEAVKASIVHLKQFLDWAHLKQDLVGAERLYEDFEKRALAFQEFHFAAFDILEDKVVFCCSLVPGSRLNPYAFDIGYWVNEAYLGQGYGKLACKLMIFVGFEYLKAERISALCNLENILSIKVLEKSGFKYEGILRNFHYKPSTEQISGGFSKVAHMVSYGMTKDDFIKLDWLNDLKQKIQVKLKIADYW